VAPGLNTARQYVNRVSQTLIPDPNRLGADQMLRCPLEDCLPCPRLLGSTDAAPVGVFPPALQGRDGHRTAVLINGLGERAQGGLSGFSSPYMLIYRHIEAAS
jgi:hypothetical protein